MLHKGSKLLFKQLTKGPPRERLDEGPLRQRLDEGSLRERFGKELLKEKEIGTLLLR